MERACQVLPYEVAAGPANMAIDEALLDAVAGGFDGAFLVCVSAENGKSRWRARGYGNGQILLLEDQGLLLILSEKGEVALVEAKPQGHHEIAKFKAIDGKTWNHPVLAHGKLFVRNGEEAACYQIQEGPTTIASNK